MGVDPFLVRQFEQLERSNEQRHRETQHAVNELSSRVRRLEDDQLSSEVIRRLFYKMATGVAVLILAVLASPLIIILSSGR